MVVATGIGSLGVVLITSGRAATTAGKIVEAVGATGRMSVVVTVAGRVVSSAVGVADIGSLGVVILSGRVVTNVG